MIRDRKKLIELFTRLGAESPESWADSQIDEGIDQFSRLAFLRQAWRSVVTRDPAWIERMARQAIDETSPSARAQHALRRLVNRGASRTDLAEFVRWMQFELMHGILYSLEGPDGSDPVANEGLGDSGWQLHATEGNTCRGPIGGVHESALAADPSAETERGIESDQTALDEWVEQLAVSRDITAMLHEQAAYASIEPSVEHGTLPYWRWLSRDDNEDAHTREFLRDGCLVILFTAALASAGHIDGWLLDHMEECIAALAPLASSDARTVRMARAIERALRCAAANTEFDETLWDDAKWAHREYVRRYYAETAARLAAMG